MLAARFCRFVLPSLPLLALGMALGALLRAVGDGKRAMLVTLIAAIVTAVLDPLMIIVFGWGLDGAAYANICARIVLAAVGFMA